jgi:hypothetical protein
LNFAYLVKQLPKLLFLKIRFQLVLLWLLCCQLASAQYYDRWPMGNCDVFNFSVNPPKIGGENIFVGGTYNGPYAVITEASGDMIVHAAEAILLKKSVFGGVSNMGERIQQNTVALLNPGHPGQFYLIMSNDSILPPPFPGSFFNSLPTKFALSAFLIDTSKYYSPPVKLDRNILYHAFCSKLTAVWNESGTGYWIIARQKDTLYSFQLTETGFGKIAKTVFPVRYDFGNLKASHDGRLLVECSNNYVSSKIYTYNFNTSTGEISGQRLLDSFVHTGSDTARPEVFHDLAFAPNDSIFYVSDKWYCKNQERTILQYARYSNNMSQSKNTFKLPCYVYRRTSEYYLDQWLSGMQLGPDGRIYLWDKSPNAGNFTHQVFSTINHPDIFGPGCGLQKGTINLPSCDEPPEQGGLPFSLYDPRRVRYSLKFSCGSIRMSNLSHQDYTSFTWYMGDGDTLLTTSRDSFNYSYPHSGKYLLRLKGTLPDGHIVWSADSIAIPAFIKSKVSFQAQDSTGCQYAAFQFNSSVITDTVDALTGPLYHWDFGDGSTEDSKLPSIRHIYTRTGSYSVKLIYSNGFCSDTFVQPQQVRLKEAPKPGFALSVNKGCAPLQVNITDQSSGKVQDYLYELGDHTSSTDASPSVIFTQSGIYVIKQYLKSANGCITVDSQTVRVGQGYDSATVFSPLRATVKDGYVNVNWEKDSIAASYLLSRSQDEGAYQILGSVTDTFFDDHNVAIQDHSYAYRLQAEDSCGHLSHKGTEAATILLKAEEIDHNYILLQWSPYHTWQNGVLHYELERQLDTGGFQPVRFTSALSTQDSDMLLQGQRSICYRIHASEKGGNAQESFSNTVCVKLKPVLWIPNAFSPDGKGPGENEKFRVWASGLYDFQLRIYSRELGLIYETTDPLQGWDGTYKGVALPLGVYIYDLRALGSEGYINKTGTFHLIR